MTPENTPTMAETDRQAQTDPWESVEAELLKAIGHPYVTVAGLPPETFAARFYAARSADAAQIANLTTERDLLKRGVATVTFGDADATIAKLVQERDAAQQDIETLRAMSSDREHAERERAERAEQEAQTLREALTRLRDCDWTIGRGDRMDAVRDISRAALAPRPQEPQP